MLPPVSSITPEILRLVAELHEFRGSGVKQNDALTKKIASEDTQATDVHPLAKTIVALLPDHEALTLSQIVKLTKGKPSCAKQRPNELVVKGYLVPKGQGRGAHYVTSR